jgi:hypothetical protein
MAAAAARIGAQLAIYAAPHVIDYVKGRLDDRSPEGRADAKDALRTVGGIADGSDRGRASLGIGDHDLRGCVVSGDRSDVVWRQLPGQVRELVAAARSGDYDALGKQAADTLGRVANARLPQLDAYGNSAAPTGTVAQRTAAVDARRAMSTALGAQPTLTAGAQAGQSQRPEAAARRTQDRGLDR